MSSTSRNHSFFEAIFCFTFRCVTALRLEYEFVTLWFSRFKMLLDGNFSQNYGFIVLFPSLCQMCKPSINCAAYWYHLTL